MICLASRAVLQRTWLSARHTRVQNRRHISSTCRLLTDKPTTPLPDAPTESTTNVVEIVTENDNIIGSIVDSVGAGFSWVWSKIPFFSSGQTELFDCVQAKLLHLYIPSLYSVIQVQTDVPWMVVMGCGTVVLRIILLPLTKRTMRLRNVTEDHMPIIKNYQEASKSFKFLKDSKKSQRLNELSAEYMTEHKIRGTLLCLPLSCVAMLIINRSYRHLCCTKPLMVGGLGPYLDMTGYSSVGYYSLPIIMVSGLAVTAFMNIKGKWWATNRLAGLMLIPASGAVFMLSYIPVGMVLHYSISCWISAGLFAARDNEGTRKFLGLPELPLKIKPVDVSKTTKAIAESVDTPQISESSPELVELPETEESGDSEPMEEEEAPEEEAPEKKRKQYRFYNAEHNTETYTPIFKVGKYAETKRDDLDMVEDNVYTASVPVTRRTSQFLDTARKTSQVLGSLEIFNLKSKVSRWWYRNKLMRHGKKGKMSEFLEEAPPIPRFIKHPVELTTEVTPGLKRYVLRKQYPTNTLEEMERKASYIERVENHRW